MNYLIGTCLILLPILLFFAGFKLGQLSTNPRPHPAEPDWQKLYSAEQRRADRWRTLFERQRNIDDLSTAARPHEQRAIDSEARRLSPPVPTRRAEA